MRWMDWEILWVMGHRVAGVEHMHMSKFLSETQTESFLASSGSGDM